MAAKAWDFLDANAPQTGLAPIDCPCPTNICMGYFHYPSEELKKQI
jgi:hypothetical protein